MFALERDSGLAMPQPCRLALGYVQGDIGFVTTGDTKLHRLNVSTKPTTEQLALAIEKRELLLNDVVLVGTQPDGQPGLKGIDPEELEQHLQVHCSVVSDATALHALLAEEAPPAGDLVVGYAIIAAGKSSGAVRWYSTQGGEVRPTDITYLGLTSQAHDIKNKSLALNQDRAAIAELIVALATCVPTASCLYVWSSHRLTPLTAMAKTDLVSTLPQHMDFKVLHDPTLTLLGGKLPSPA